MWWIVGETGKCVEHLRQGVLVPSPVGKLKIKCGNFEIVISWTTRNPCKTGSSTISFHYGLSKTKCVGNSSISNQNFAIVYFCCVPKKFHTLPPRYSELYYVTTQYKVISDINNTPIQLKDAHNWVLTCSVVCTVTSAAIKNCWTGPIEVFRTVAPGDPGAGVIPTWRASMWGPPTWRAGRGRWGLNRNI
jgi:hypothetical protein